MKFETHINLSNLYFLKSNKLYLDSSIVKNRDVLHSLLKGEDEKLFNTWLKPYVSDTRDLKLLTPAFIVARYTRLLIFTNFLLRHTNLEITEKSLVGFSIQRTARLVITGDTLIDSKKKPILRKNMSKKASERFNKKVAHTTKSNETFSKKYTPLSSKSTRIGLVDSLLRKTPLPSRYQDQLGLGRFGAIQRLSKSNVDFTKFFDGSKWRDSIVSGPSLRAHNYIIPVFLVLASVALPNLYPFYEFVYESLQAPSAIAGFYTYTVLFQKRDLSRTKYLEWWWVTARERERKAMGLETNLERRIRLKAERQLRHLKSLPKPLTPRSTYIKLVQTFEKDLLVFDSASTYVLKSYLPHTPYNITLRPIYNRRPPLRLARMDLRIDSYDIFMRKLTSCYPNLLFTTFQQNPSYTTPQFTLDHSKFVMFDFNINLDMTLKKELLWLMKNSHLNGDAAYLSQRHVAVQNLINTENQSKVLTRFGSWYKFNPHQHNFIGDKSSNLIDGKFKIDPTLARLPSVTGCVRSVGILPATYSIINGVASSIAFITSRYNLAEIGHKTHFILFPKLTDEKHTDTTFDLFRTANSELLSFSYEINNFVNHYLILNPQLIPFKQSGTAANVRFYNNTFTKPLLSQGDLLYLSIVLSSSSTDDSSRLFIPVLRVSPNIFTDPTLLDDLIQ